MKRKLQINDHRQIKQWEKISRDLVARLENREIFLNLSDSSTVLYESDCIRAVSETLDESTIRNLLLKCMLDADNQSPGASYVMLCALIDNHNVDAAAGHRFSFLNLASSLQRLVGKDAANICVEATKIAGRRGKIFLDPSVSSISEIRCGSQLCRWKPDQSFFTGLLSSRVSVQNCRVVFIDGIIESVTECHKIFQESFDNKVPIVMFSRGFSEEVQATAAINFQRQTAQVIPIVIPFDEVGVNGMGDLASCFNSELISSDKGQLVSSVNISLCPLVERITCSLNGTEIEHSKSCSDAVIARLMKKLDSSDANQSELVRRRIEALGSGMVTIKIGNEKKSLAGIQRDRVDFGLRYIRYCMRYGVVEFRQMMMPSKSIAAGINCAESFSNSVKNSKVILEVDRCG